MTIAHHRQTTTSDFSLTLPGGWPSCYELTR